jgi:hypothetical protein
MLPVGAFILAVPFLALNLIPHTFHLISNQSTINLDKLNQLNCYREQLIRLDIHQRPFLIAVLQISSLFN